MKNVYDYIVVGSGFGGSVASLRLSASGDVSNFHRTIKLVYTSIRNPIKFLKVIFDLKWSKTLVIFLVMQHIDNAMRMVWKPGIFGGCLMSDNFSKGVVDPDLAVHGYPGMYIVYGSVLQGNIGVNPSFTILAMTEYAMSKVPEKKGNRKKKLIDQLSETA